jgi:glycosyltransferase involved in cell wall biosynthesis
MSELPRWLYISKPIAPPWRDGSVNLVRDIATHVRKIKPHVFTTLPLGSLEGVELVQATTNRYVSHQLQLLAHASRSASYTGYHFVFAPNSRTCLASRALLVARRVLKRVRSVQTIASPPLAFAGVDSLLFGDVIVAQSEWMRRKLVEAGVTRPIELIPPCARAPIFPSQERCIAVRKQLGLHAGPVVVYPGDYEVSSGAATVAAAAPSLVAAGVQVVFACRPKTPRAADVRAELQTAHLAAGISASVVHAGVVDDLPALLATALAVLFPVDNLYGKVDLPLVLLEAMALGTPIVAASGGPLEELDAVRLVAPQDPSALSGEVLGLLADPAAASAQAERAKSVYAARYSPAVVAAAYDTVYRRFG